MSVLNAFTSLGAKVANKVLGPVSNPEEQDAINKALILSVRKGQRLTAAFDIAMGADVHAEAGRPLAEAAFEGDLKMVRFLFERGAVITDRHLNRTRLGEKLCSGSGDGEGAAQNARVWDFLQSHRPALRSARITMTLG
jgi:hypothetical protein